ncbi:MAG TPA: HAD family hydrolase [Candidatus Dormibacteraeota bacterium]|nr:HAD family hydrolase [Candidatus Dormibacteraeota bacterium]
MTQIAFLLDVDNTLINNDKVKADLEERILRYGGTDYAPRFWEEYERVRGELDYVDLPVTLKRFRQASPGMLRFAELAAAVLFYPFEECLYAGAMDVLEHLRGLGTIAIVSDGDPVFQPAKIARAGLAAAVEDHVLIYVHKERRLADVRRRIPADLYVLIDDKPAILEAAKADMSSDIVTVHVHQGKYARESHKDDPIADIELASIADVLQLTRSDFEAPARGAAR